MMGNASDPGVTPRVAEYIFERAERLTAFDDEDYAAGISPAEVQIYASYLQIYKEHLQDLLAHDPTASDLNVRRDPKTGVYVQGLSERPLSDVSELAQLIEQGNKKRVVASTLMNAHSSRSHALVIIRVEQDLPAGEAAAEEGATADRSFGASSSQRSTSSISPAPSVRANRAPRGRRCRRRSPSTRACRRSVTSSTRSPTRRRVGARAGTHPVPRLQADPPARDLARRQLEHGDARDDLAREHQLFRDAPDPPVRAARQAHPDARDDQRVPLCGAEPPPSPVLEEIHETLLETRDAIVEPVAEQAAAVASAAERCCGTLAQACAAVGHGCVHGCIMPYIRALGDGFGALVGCVMGGWRGMIAAILALANGFFDALVWVWNLPGRAAASCATALVQWRDGLSRRPRPASARAACGCFSSRPFSKRSCSAASSSGRSSARSRRRSCSLPPS